MTEAVVPSRTLRFDHAVILVDDLVAAVQNFSDVGFTVVPGGEHAGGLTHNALIVFEDGTYLELLAFTKPWIPRLARLTARLGLGGLVGSTRLFQRRILTLGAASEGLVDFALHSSNLADDLRTARELGANLEGPRRGGRRRPDGNQVTWDLVLSGTSGLPFLISDVTPRSLRVPEGPVRRHRNGAVGTAAIVVAVADLDRATKGYRALLGIEGEAPPVVRHRTPAVGFLVEGTVITLVGPEEAAGELSSYVRRRGEGAYAISLLKEGVGGPHTLDPAKTHGTLISFLREPRPDARSEPRRPKHPGP